ncbi:hypothetical protein HDU80_005661 [Chytriomyces hyalinus]|nr:hypothetical protein HDU80_005661 [Chytriomyces hyalinus]
MNRLGFFARRFNSVARTFTENSPASFPSVKETMAPHAYQEYQHAYKSTNTWFYLNFAITIPGLAAALYFCVPPELEHLNHLLEHPREFEDLPYMRKRKTPFPWGDNSLFHNDHANPIADISFKIETERRVLQGAKLMYGQLRGAAEKEACEANMFETSRRIEYFEGLLQEAYVHQNGEAPPPQSAKSGKQDFTRRLSSLAESQHNQNTAAADGNLGYAQRGVLSFFGLSKRASSASLNSSDSHTSIFGLSKRTSAISLNPSHTQALTRTGFDLVKYGLAITPSRVQGRLQDVLYKLDVEYRIKSDTENLLRVRMNDGANDVPGLKAKLTENAKIALLERAKRRYVALDVGALALRTDENRVKGCDNVCHVKCFSNVITKCITHEDMQTATRPLRHRTTSTLPHQAPFSTQNNYPYSIMDKERESIDAALHEAELERRRSELQREQEMKAQNFAAAAAAAAAVVAKPEPVAPLGPSNYPPNVQVSIPKVLQKNTTIEDFEFWEEVATEK